MNPPLEFFSNSERKSPQRGLGRSIERWRCQCNFPAPSWAPTYRNALCFFESNRCKLCDLHPIFCGPLSTLLHPVLASSFPLWQDFSKRASFPIDWFWKLGWLIHKWALCTRIAKQTNTKIAHLPQWMMRSHESLSTPRTFQFVRKIGSQNQSIVGVDCFLSESWFRCSKILGIRRNFGCIWGVVKFWEFEAAAAGEPIWDPGVFTIIIIFFPYWWLSYYNKLFYLSSKGKSYEIGFSAKKKRIGYHISW